MNRRALTFIKLTDPAFAHEAVSQLYNARESEVSMIHPIELFLTRELLINAVELSLEQLHTQRAAQEQDETIRDYVDALIQQRVDFLERLRADRNDTVLMALYPSGAEDEDVLGPIDDEDDIDGVSDFLKDDDLPR